MPPYSYANKSKNGVAKLAKRPPLSQELQPEVLDLVTIQLNFREIA